MRHETPLTFLKLRLASSFVAQCQKKEPVYEDGSFDMRVLTGLRQFVTIIAGFYLKNAKINANIQNNYSMLILKVSTPDVMGAAGLGRE